MENMFSIENNLLTIKFNSKLLKFTNYESMELDIFSQKLYSNLSVKNKTVIDVGGGVGGCSTGLFLSSFKTSSNKFVLFSNARMLHDNNSSWFSSSSFF